MSTAGAALNRLSTAKSPYLLQHANNPVDWYEWSADAFAKAQAEDKMIFLSVGYSSCHWCHVMAHESFEDEAIASVLNAHFVSIKVDREERPDVDASYMQFIVSISAHGGWPMNVFLTPHGKPLFGGTYFPPQTFPGLLNRLETLWRTERERCEASANDVAKQLQSHSTALARPSSSSAELPSLSLIAKAAQHFKRSFDSVHGGFGDAPKFPSVSQSHHFLHRYAHALRRASSPGLADVLVPGSNHEDRTREADTALYASAYTLLQISRGGIHDHISKGFARYSVDSQWHVPHFEKMLYDQGQLLSAYVECIQLIRMLCDSSSDLKMKERVEPMLPELIAAAEGIILYLERDLQNPHGGAFFSSEDADSFPTHAAAAASEQHSKKNAREGAFYVFTQHELESILGPRRTPSVALFMAHFGVKQSGNIDPATDPHGELTGTNVLHAQGSLADTAALAGVSVPEMRSAIDDGLQKVHAWRKLNRPRPGLDDKIVTAWNAYAISGLVKASEVLDSARALDLAQRAMSFVLEHLVDPETGALHRSYREFGRGPTGFSNDYAAVVQALLDLYETTLDPLYLARALEMQRKQDELFWDEESGGWFIAAAADSDVDKGGAAGTPSMIRAKDGQDGAEPAASSVGAHNLLRLINLFSDDTLVGPFKAELTRALGSTRVLLDVAPHALGTMLTARLYLERGLVQVIVVGDPEEERTRAMLDEVRGGRGRRFGPDWVVVHVDPFDMDVGEHPLYKYNEAVRGIVDGIRGGSSTSRVEEVEDWEGPHVHVCRAFACGMPLRSVEALREALDAT